MNGNSQPCPQYGKAFRWALRRLRGNSNAKVVYVTVVACCPPANAIHPSVNQLADEAGISRTRWSDGWAVCRNAGVLDAKEVRDQHGHRAGYHYIQATEPSEETESPDPAGGIWEESPDPADRIKEPSPDPAGGIWEALDPAGGIKERRTPDPAGGICSLIQIRREEEPPLPPLERGGGPEIPQPRITRADRQRADIVLKHRFSRCWHDTLCRSPDECRARLAAEYALARAEQDRVIQHGTAPAAMGQ